MTHSKTQPSESHVSRCYTIVQGWPTKTPINSSFFWVIRRRKVAWKRRYGTTCRSHVQGSRNVGFKTSYAAKQPRRQKSSTAADALDDAPNDACFYFLTFNANNLVEQYTNSISVVVYIHFTLRLLSNCVSHSIAEGLQIIPSRAFCNLRAACCSVQLLCISETFEYMFCWKNTWHSL